MKKLLFVENRYATHLYEGIARVLIRQGIDVHWLVQNPMFRPRVGTVHDLPMPRRDQLRPCPAEFKSVARSDRGINFFGASDEHYAHYAELIARVLNEVRPDLVCAEQTQFHELLTIRICHELGILFLSPNASRLPPGRIVFFAEDTIRPVGGSGETLSETQAAAMIDAISQRRLNAFTNASSEGRKPTVWNRLRMKAEFLRVLVGWIAGERFITPSPWLKHRLARQLCEATRWWESFASRQLPASLAGKPWVLYPLQMQPETNLDVWGLPWNNQAEIIRRSAAALREMGAFLVVKPNPTSKYELLGAEMRAAMQQPNVVALSKDMAMRDIFEDVPLVLSVTGTVQLECVFSGKPVAVLGDHEMSRLPGVSRLARPEDLPVVLQAVMAGKGITASQAEKVRALNDIYRTSYRGYIFDPVNSPDYMSQDNLRSLAAAFVDQLDALGGHRPAPAVPPELALQSG